ncbi:MAG: hypothetical protein LBV69_02685 [Bacteroidales bacterium]|jgi:hypothetical protein|nr:hypothetical protein [Bacteroidales bacterium]
MTTLTKKDEAKLLRKITCDKDIFDIPIISNQNINCDDTNLISYKYVNNSKFNNRIIHFFLFDKVLDGI